MKRFLENMQPRERNLVIAGAAALVLAILYLAVWEPFDAGHQDALAQKIAEQRSNLAWMRGAAQQIQQLRGGAGQVAANGQSLLALVDQTAREHQLSGAVKRIEPAGQSSARVWVEQAEFDALVVWFDLLQQRHGVRIKNITVEDGGVPGRVSARVTFEGGST